MQTIAGKFIFNTFVLKPLDLKWKLLKHRAPAFPRININDKMLTCSVSMVNTCYWYPKAI